MYVENKNVTADPAGEGVVRKVLSYSPNYHGSGASF